MSTFFKKVGFFLFFKSSGDLVRSGIVFAATQFVFLIGIIFLAECVFILLGVNDVFLPFAQSIKTVLEKMLF
jgi:hypothetical protein